VAANPAAAATEFPLLSSIVPDLLRDDAGSGKTVQDALDAVKARIQRARDATASLLTQPDDAATSVNSTKAK
jgi:hypothetical protein